MIDWPFRPPATWAREIVARLLGLPLGWLIAGPRVTGAEHLARLERPFLVCPNHSSHLDSSALRLALGPRYRQRLAIAAASDYFWRSRRRAFLAGWLGGFPFSRDGRGGLESLKAVEALLARGWSVLIYPEGTRSRTGEMATFKPGVGFVAVRTGRPVLPVRIVGSWSAFPPGARRPRHSPVEVRFGGPLRARPGEDARAFTDRLEAAVRGL
jgi:1-acyl-sn-glycerol-3-phosphate acyltransferase